MIEPIPTASMKAMLTAMLSGWCAKNNDDQSESSGPVKDEADYMLAFSENRAVAELLSLFSHWSNDILCIAGEFGVCTERNSDGLWVVEDTPPKPSDKYYWSPGDYRWNQQTQDYDWVRGSWKPMIDEREMAS